MPQRCRDRHRSSFAACGLPLYLRDFDSWVIVCSLVWNYALLVDKEGGGKVKERNETRGLVSKLVSRTLNIFKFNLFLTCALNSQKVLKAHTSFVILVIL